MELKAATRHHVDGKAELRTALLNTKVNEQGQVVYEREIFYCACHVHPEGIVVGQRAETFATVDGFRILETAEIRSLPTSIVPPFNSARPFTPPKMRHTSPLARDIMAENAELTNILVRIGHFWQSTMTILP